MLYVSYLKSDYIYYWQHKNMEMPDRARVLIELKMQRISLEYYRNVLWGNMIGVFVI